MLQRPYRPILEKSRAFIKFQSASRIFKQFGLLRQIKWRTFCSIYLCSWPTKRWHDRNKSGWWNLISFIPIAGPIWAFIELGFLKGTPGANLYGLPPDARLCDDYGARISHARDALVRDPLTESGPVTDDGSVRNAWRGA